MRISIRKCQNGKIRKRKELLGKVCTHLNSPLAFSRQRPAGSFDLVVFQKERFRPI